MDNHSNTKDLRKALISVNRLIKQRFLFLDVSEDEVENDEELLLHPCSEAFINDDSILITLRTRRNCHLVFGTDIPIQDQTIVENFLHHGGKIRVFDFPFSKRTYKQKKERYPNSKIPLIQRIFPFEHPEHKGLAMEFHDPLRF